MENCLSKKCMSHKQIKIILFSLFCLIPGLISAQIPEKDFSYLYALSKNDFTVANIERRLRISPNKLIFSSYTYPVGFASLFISDTINEKSIISIINKQIRTQSYSYVKKSDNNKEQFHIKFDWANKLIIDSRGKTPFNLTSNSFDPLSFQLALARAAQKKPINLSFTLVENKHVKTYKLKFLGQENLETDAGSFSTHKFEYFDEVKKRKIIIWCAEQLNYLPVQIKRIDDDGDYGMLKLISRKGETGNVPDKSDNDF